MLRISKMTDYAVVILTELANGGQEADTASALAERTRLAQPTVSKLLKTLQAAGIVRSIRGRNGGYALVNSPNRVTLTTIIEAVEGPIAMTECALESGRCEIETDCSVRPHWRLINGAIREALNDLTLDELGQKPIKPDSTASINDICVSERN
jgi:FeS assembly SUF system regulator